MSRISAVGTIFDSVDGKKGDYAIIRNRGTKYCITVVNTVKDVKKSAYTEKVEKDFVRRIERAGKYKGMVVSKNHVVFTIGNYSVRVCRKELLESIEV